MYYLINPRNPGGIKATLERWYEQYRAGEIENDWIAFNGVEVIKIDGLPSGDEWRMVGSVSDIGAIETINPEGHMSLHGWLYNDY